MSTVCQQILDITEEEKKNDAELIDYLLLEWWTENAALCRTEIQSLQGLSSRSFLGFSVWRRSWHYEITALLTLNDLAK